MDAENFTRNIDIAASLAQMSCIFQRADLLGLPLST